VELHTFIKCPKCGESIRASWHIPEECKKESTQEEKEKIIRGI